MGEPSAERLPEATYQRMWRSGQRHLDRNQREGTCPLILRASRVKKVVANSAQSHQVHSYMGIRTGRRRKSIASVERNVDLGQYVVK